MRRGGVGVGVLRVFMGKVYAEAGAWLSLMGTPENPVTALVVQGGYVLTIDGQTHRLVPGSTFEVPRGAPHSRRCRPERATFWVRRRGRRRDGSRNYRWSNAFGHTVRQLRRTIAASSIWYWLKQVVWREASHSGLSNRLVDCP